MLIALKVCFFPELKDAMQLCKFFDKRLEWFIKMKVKQSHEDHHSQVDVKFPTSLLTVFFLFTVVLGHIRSIHTINNIQIT